MKTKKVKLNYLSIIRLSWLLPLLFGLIIFLLWILFRSDIFEILGMINIFFGLIIGFIGIILACIKIFDKSSGYRISTLIINIVLIILNVVIAVIIVISVFLIETVYIISITNNSDYKISNCKIEGGGISQEIEDIASKESRISYFWIKNDGVLLFKYSTKNKEIIIDFNEYVTNNLGGHKILKIENNSYSIKDK